MYLFRMLLLMVGLALLILPNRPQPTLTFWDENHRSRTLGQQRIANCALHRVDDALYGTAICDIGNTVETRCTNATLVDCDRIQFASRNQQSPNPVNENKTITSSADRYSYPDSSLDIVFTDSNLTSTTQTGGTSFYMIELTQFAGKLSLTGCAIEGQFNPKLIGIVKITAKLEAFPRLVIEGCFVTFSCQTPLSAFDSQFQLQYSVFTQVSNSVFKAPEGEQTGIRLFRPIDSLGVFEMSGCRFQQQSTSGNGAVVLDSLSLVLTVFDSTFSDNTATLGGCFYSHRDVLYFHRCHFSNNVANMRGGVLSIYAQVLFHADSTRTNPLERINPLTLPKGRNSLPSSS